MDNLFHIVLRIAAGLIGALLLYIAFFLYEDEEDRLQNRLEQIWKWIDALQKTATSREIAFLHGTARATRLGLDHLLGRQLLSVRSAAISVVLSFGSFLAFLVSGTPTVRDKFLLSVCAFVMLLLGLLPALAFSEDSTPDSRSASSHRAYYLCVVGAVVLLPFMAVWLPRLWVLWAAVPWGIVHPEPLFLLNLHLLERTELVICLGTLSDTAFVIFFRWTLRQIENVSAFWKLLLHFLSLIVVLALLAGPALAYVYFRPLDLFGFFWNLGFKSDRMQIVAFAFVNLSMTNLADAACLLLLIAVMAVLLAHRIMWPLIKRPLYAANRKGLIKNTKLLGYLGTAFLTYALSNHPFIQWLTDFLPKLKGG